MTDPMLLGASVFAVAVLLSSIGTWRPEWFPTGLQRTIWVVPPFAATAPAIVVILVLVAFAWLPEYTDDHWLGRHDFVIDVALGTIGLALVLAVSLSLYRRPRFLLPPELKNPTVQHVVKTVDRRGRVQHRAPVTWESIRTALAATRAADGTVLAGSPQVRLAGDWRRGRFRVLWGTGGVTAHSATWEEPVDLDAVTDDLVALLNAGIVPRSASKAR